MGKLHLFSDGVEYYSAETLEEAYVARESHTGMKRDESELAQVDDERELTVWVDHEGAMKCKVTRTAAEWAALAMGFAFSTEA